MITKKEAKADNEEKDGSWLIYAVLSAVFASLTAILGKNRNCRNRFKSWHSHPDDSRFGYGVADGIDWR